MKKNNSSLSILIIFVFCLSNTINIIYSQSFNWTRTNGPNEGTVNDLYISSDGKLYAASFGGVFVSEDNGDNWSYIGLGNKVVTAIASYNGVLFAGTSLTYSLSEGENGLFISTNNGNTWQLSSLGICGVNDIFISNSGKIFVTFFTSSFYDGYCAYSVNNGNSWVNINQLTGFSCGEFSEGPVNSIYISAWRASMVYTTDDGSTWITNGNSQNGINSIDASVNGYIFGGSSDMLYRSTNNGLNWDSVNYMNIYRVTEVKSFNNGFTFTGTVYDGIWRSSNFGNNWIGFWYPDSNTSVVACLEKNNNDIWSSFFNGSLYKSSNYGNVWEEKANALSGTMIYSLYSTSNGNILCGTVGGMHVSTDNGTNWKRVSIDNITIRSFTENSNGDVFAFGTKIYKSTNQGLNWQIIHYNHPNTIYYAINSNNILYYTADNGIYKSTNNGASWQLSFYHQSSIYNISSNSNGHVFANSNSKVFRTTNNGVNWLQIHIDSSGLNVIQVSPNNNIYVSKQRSVLKSTNNGNTFVDLNLNIDVNFNKLLFVNDNDFVIGSEKNGVYYYDGTSCVPLNSGLDIKYIWSLAMNSEGKLLAGTLKSGIYISQGSIGINPISSQIPSQFSLSQNYPNPFNPATKIKFKIPLLRGVDAEGGRGVFVQLSIHDILGREVKVLVNEKLAPGTYEVDWDASAFPSGVYFYTITSGEYSETRKMVLLK